MADYINMKQVPGGTVTAVDDRILYDVNLHSGIIYGCEVSYIGNNMIHINAGYGVIKGGLFEMEDHTEYVDYAETNPTTGQIYIKFDAAAVDKIVIVKETTNSLHPLEQDDDANFDSGVYEIQLCTFTATTTALENVTQTFPRASGAVDILDSLELIATNLSPNKCAGALAVKQLNNNLTANSNPFRFGYDAESGKYGYILPDGEGGADSLHFFSSLDVSNVSVSYYCSPYGTDRITQYEETLENDCLLLIIGNVSRDTYPSEIDSRVTYKRNNADIPMTNIIMPNAGSDGAYQKYAIIKANKNDVISGHISSNFRSNIVMLIKITP